MQIFDENDLILPVNDAEAAYKFIMQGLQCWQDLALRNLTLGKRRWKLRPKHHYVDHIARDVRRTRLNPRLVMQCFQEESYLGHIKRIGVHCHSAQMMTRLFQRLMILLAVRFKDNITK